MKQLLRDINIDLVLGNKNSIIDTFNGIWDDLSVAEVDVYHNHGEEFIYYNSKNEWVFFIDVKSDIFWCHYDRYWSIFETGFNLRYTYIKIITLLLMESALNKSLPVVKYRKNTELAKLDRALMAVTASI